MVRNGWYPITYLKNDQKINVLSIGNKTDFLSKIYTKKGFNFSQNTTNLDINQFYDDIFSGLNVAFGAPVSSIS